MNEFDFRIKALRRKMRCFFALLPRGDVMLIYFVREFILINRDNAIKIHRCVTRPDAGSTMFSKSAPKAGFDPAVQTTKSAGKTSSWQEQGETKTGHHI